MLRSAGLIKSLAYFCAAVVFGAVVSPLAAQCSLEWKPAGAIASGLNKGPGSAVFYDDGNGPALYVGGAITTAGEHVVNGVAKWDGVAWSPLGSGLSDPVYDQEVSSLIVYKGELIVAGQFTSAGGTPANNIARWNGSSWSPLGDGLTRPGRPYCRVLSLAVYNDELIAGGTFNTAGGQPAAGIAKWDGTAWSTLGEGLGWPNNTPFAKDMTIYQNELVVGGSFTSAGGVPALCLARWNGSTWSAAGLVPGGNSLVGGVQTLAEYNGELIVGGGLTTVDGVDVKNIARWNGSGWSPLGDGLSTADPNMPEQVRNLAVFNGELFVTGLFEQAGAVAVHGFAKWDGNSWSYAGSGLEPTGDFGVGALLDCGDALLVGGSFETAGGVPARGIAFWSGTQWSTLNEPPPTGMDGAVNALTSYNGDLIAGGSFTNVDGAVCNRIARWNGSSWSPLGSGADNGVNGKVNSLLVYGGDLIVGGDFTQAGGVTVNNIARWNGSSWSALGAIAGTNALVYALTVYNNELIVGGGFTSAGGVSVKRIARWDGSVWKGFGDGVSKGFDTPSVWALATWQGHLFAGGGFVTADGVTVNHLAQWDGTSWVALGSGTTVGSGTVLALAAYGDHLIAAGYFSTAGGVSAAKIAQWDGTAWSPLGAGINRLVKALTVYEGELIAAGKYETAGGQPAGMIARWNGSTWATLGQGINHTWAESCTALATWQGDLVVGGDFKTVAEHAWRYVARWGPADAPLADMDFDCDVDMDDIAAFAECGGGPGLPSPANCTQADLDGDGDVDQDDFGIIQRALPDTEVPVGQTAGS